MRTAFCVTVALLALLPSPARAAQEQPYRLRIVLVLAKHRLLTDVLADKLERELGDGLQAALDGMARVEVVRHHELLAKIENQGLERALDGWNNREPIKTHFLLVDHVDSYYQVRAMQYDGRIGQAGPILRTERTRDREFVFRLAGLLVQQDFGLTGTVTEYRAEARQAVIHLDGGASAWDAWVKPGDVFALVRVPGTTGTTEPIPSAYLQVISPPTKGDRSGSCVCKVANRYTLPNLTGFRVVKLGTTSGPVRLRLVKSVTFTRPGEDLILNLRRAGFDGENDKLLRGSTDTKGAFDTTGREKGEFDRLVFVTVMQGNKTLAQQPVPLLGQREVVIPVTLGEGDDPLQVLRDSWVNAVREAYLVQSDQMAELQKKASKPEEREETRRLAERLRDRTGDDLALLRKQRGELVGLAEKTASQDRLLLDSADQRLKRIEEAQTDIRNFLAKIDEIDIQEKDPKRRANRGQVEQAVLLVRKGELGKAIAIYEQLVAQGFTEGGIEARIVELKKLWDPKSPEHAEARRFLDEVYPTLDTETLHLRFAEVRGAFEEFKKVGDKLGARKLLNLTTTHADRVIKEKNALLAPPRPENQPLVEQLNTVGESLEKLAKDLAAFLATR